jgi:hypothetical protein
MLLHQRNLLPGRKAQSCPSFLFLSLQLLRIRRAEESVRAEGSGAAEKRVKTHEEKENE